VVVKITVIIIVPVVKEGLDTLPMVYPAGNQVVTTHSPGETIWKLI